MAEEMPFQNALSRAMALCSKREFCIGDIRAKLDSWGIREPDQKRITAFLVKENFINEKRFAEAYVKDKFTLNKWGRIKIRIGLRAKKIPEKIIAGALEGIDDRIYNDTIESLIKKHRKSIRAGNGYEIRAKLMRFGLSRGYESDLLYKITGEIE